MNCKLIRRFWLRLLALLCLLAGPALPVRAQAPGLFAAHPSPPATPPRGRPFASRQRPVRIDFERLRDALPAQAGGRGLTNRINLNLFPDADFTAVRESVETTDTGYVWTGRLESVPEGSATLAVSGSAAQGWVMSGNVVTPTATFAIRFASGDAHSIEQVDLNSMPPEGEPQQAPARFAVAADLPAAQVDDGSRIDLIVVWTPSARIAAGGTAAMQSLIDLGVTETNQAYASTGAIQRIRLRRKEEIAYTEAGFNMLTDLDRLQNPSDGYLDAVHSLRTTYAADMVQLVENSGDSCGYAYVMDTESTAFENAAFSVVHHTCISPNYSMAHELGHNMGLHHDAYVDSGTVLFGYARGYVNQASLPAGGVSSQRWRTIMAYNNQCSDNGYFCTRLKYFSNPANLYPTSGSPQDPMGVVGTANSGLALDNTRDTVANFRAEILEPLDNFANARTIFITNFSDTLATAPFTSEGTDPTPACGGGVKAKSAWYRFTPLFSGVAQISTAGSNYDTILSVYSGTTGSFASQGCNDDANATPQSLINVNVTAGTTYSIMISAKNNDGGTLQVTTTLPVEKKRRSQRVSD
jgi:hypothetical protein